MLHEYRDIISKIKVENAHFAKIFEKHNELDKAIADVEEGREHMDDFDQEKLKKGCDKYSLEFLLNNYKNNKRWHWKSGI